MTKKISDTKTIIEFLAIAKKFCLLVEKRDEKTAIQLLQGAFIILPQLCLRAMRLPDINRIPNYELPSRPTAQWQATFKSLQHKLKGFDMYIDVFDPYDEKDHEPIAHSISDELLDIYYGFKPGLKKWLKVAGAEKRYIIWQWKWGFENAWGQHATSAFNALYSLLYAHIEGGIDLYIGIREEG